MKFKNLKHMFKQKLLPVPDDKIRSEYFHITPTKFVDEIMKTGLKPNTPKDFQDSEGVYLFLSIEDAESAMGSWFSERDIFGFEGEENYITEFSLLKIDPEGIEKIDETNASDYELVVLNRIDPKYIKVLKNNF